MPSRFSSTVLSALHERLKSYVDAKEATEADLNASSDAENKLVQAIIERCPANEKQYIIMQALAAIDMDDIKHLYQQRNQAINNLFESRNNIAHLNSAIELSYWLGPTELKLLKEKPLVLEYKDKKYQLVYTVNGDKIYASINHL